MKGFIYKSFNLSSSLYLSIYFDLSIINKLPSRLGLQRTANAPLQRGKTPPPMNV